MLPADEFRVAAQFHPTDGTRLRMVGRVEVPQEAFVAALSTTEPTKR